MPRSLVIAIHFHDGRYHGEEDRFEDAKGWPPSPARLFQALVASAAGGGLLEAQHEEALGWLECLPPPRIAAPPAHRGRPLKLFVPNNDLDSVGGDPAKVSKIRVGKGWRPCFFDPSKPILYVWDFESGESFATCVCAIAERLCQLGRGIDMAWAQGQVVDAERAQSMLDGHPGALRIPGGVGKVPTPHPGTLQSLLERHRRSRSRLRTEGIGRKQRQLFSQPPPASFARIGYDTPIRRLHFELRGDKGGFAPQPLDSAFLLITSLRDAAADRLANSMPDETTALIERFVVGRNAGAADISRRIRILPIPSIGAEYTDPSIRRIVVEVPAECPLRLDDLKWAFAGMNTLDPQASDASESRGSLVSTEDSRMADRFSRPACGFQTMTPVALMSAQRRRIGEAGEKSADERQDEERRAAGAVIQALRHVGLRAKPSHIRVQREPFQKRGALAESFAKGSRFSKHALWHVALRFRDPIQGPLVIGDGRFCGLGLMVPIDQPQGILAFYLGRSHPQRDWPVLIRALRRALMSLAADDGGRVERLFSGHEPDGRADGAGHHAHVFLAADATPTAGEAHTRLIVAAPWAADRNAKQRRHEHIEFGNVVRQLRDLRAGSLGRFTGLVCQPVEDNDPLVGPARVWIGQTPYVATHHMKKGSDPVEVVEYDVVKECKRRGFPKPSEVEVQSVNVGPRGGRPTAMVKLRFAVAERGPILLGRTCHEGGGLFHAVTSTPVPETG